MSLCIDAPASTVWSKQPPRMSGSNGAIQVHPPVGEFVNFDVDTTYVIPFTIRNVTREMRTVRFTPPNNQRAFHINPSSVRLAPGLTHRVEVEFITHTPQDFQDYFVVLTDTESISVPLVAKCSPDLEFPATLPFGRVERNQSGQSKLLRFTNRGRKDVRVTVTPSREAVGVVVSPPDCVVPAMGTAGAYVELTRLDVGRHRLPLLVVVEGESASRTVLVTVEVADCKGVLLDPRSGTVLHSLTFAKTYAGTRRAVEVDVRNESEQPVSFAFQTSGEAPPFAFSPAQGRLHPRGTVRVTAVFSPPAADSPRGWSSQRATQRARGETFEALYALIFVETEHTHSLRVTGESTTTLAWLSRPVVDFGTCAMNDHRDVTITVHNGHEDTPLRFSFPRVAHFRFAPVNGTVAPGGGCEVRLTFHPRRLGAYEERVEVVFNETQRQPLALSGVAVGMIPEAKIVGGPDKIPEDFHITPKPAVEAETSTDAATPRGTVGDRCLTMRRPPIPAAALPQGRSRTHATRSHCFSSSSATTVNAAAATAAAASSERVGDVDGDVVDVDLGMLPAEGLRPPEPQMPPLTLKMKSRSGYATRGTDEFSPVTLDAKTLIKKVFKEAPTNAAERRDCRRELQPMDLLRVAAPIKVLDYQRVTVGSRSTKTFFLYNGTSAAVLATMPTEEAHLTFSPLSQVIPAGRAAAFEVSFYSSAVQTYQQVVQININGRHVTRFTLQADVVPVEVSLSQDEVVLQFADFSMDPVARATVSLANHGNSKAHYTWELTPNHPFTIVPGSGVIAPMSKETAQVTFSPPQGILSAETAAVLRVTGATILKTLRLRGVVAPTVCVWGNHGAIEQSVEMRQVPAGIATASIVAVQNKGRRCAFYSFDTPPEWLHITPSRGRIAPGEAEEIKIYVCHEVAEVLQASLVCGVRGMRRPLRLNLSATICVAPLSVVWPKRRDGEVLLAFGSVYIGTERALPLRLNNSGDVATLVTIDMRPHTAHTIRGEMVADESTTTAMVGATMNSSHNNDNTSNGGGLMHVTVPPHGEATMRVVYRPVTTGGDERFFVVWRHVGAAELQQLPPLAISCRAMLSRVAVRRQLLEFPRTVVGSTAVPIALTIENTSAESLSWELLRAASTDDDEGAVVFISDDAPSAFRMDTLSGTLAAHGSHTVHVMFIPSVVGQHEARYVVVVDGDRLSPCAEVRVNGFAARPGITSDRVALNFPAVPLGVKVEETLTIMNDGFDAIEVRYKSEEEGPLVVTFPRGAVARAASPQVFVRIEFCSTRPLTFASSITFTSDRGETLTIPVTGTAINSFLTTAMHIIPQRHRGRIVCDGPRKPAEDGEDGMVSVSPFMYIEETESGRHHRLSAPPTPPPLQNLVSRQSRSIFGLTDAVGRFHYSRHAIENLRQWLNQNVLREPLGDLVSGLQSTNGRPLIEAARSHTGKWPGRGDRPVPRGKALAALDALTSLIQSAGGCLSEVPLAHLMPYETYCEYETAEGAEVLSMSDFAVSADYAWVTVVLQFVRVFFMARVDISAALQSHPTMRNHIPLTVWETPAFRSALSQSNLFSPAECLLLFWLTHNYCQCVGEGLLRGSPRSPAQCAELLRDCVAQLACVLVYIPSVAARLSLERVNADDVTQADVEANASILLSALSFIGISIHCTPRELLEYSMVDWLLFSATLFRHLPRFLPTAVISLEGKLLAPMRRTVDINNTSSTPRSYTVEMSNPAFRAVPRDLNVGPNTTTQIELEVTLRFNRRMEGECILVDTSPGCPVEEQAPIVFGLVAIPNNEPLRVININTPLYTQLHYDVLVESPFQNSCVATLRLSQEFKKDESFPEGKFGKGLPSAFFTSAGVVPFRVGESTKVPIYFAPCARGRYEARITFHDELQGEFSYLVIGTCTPPKSIDRVSVRAEAGEESTHTLHVRLQNPPFERALRALEENTGRRPAAQQQQQQQQQQKQQQRQSARSGRGLIPDLSKGVYTVTFVNEANVGPHPFFSAPETVNFDEGSSSTPLTFTFAPKVIGEYNGFILLASMYDVRAIQVSAKCVPTGEKGILRFACPARQSITQSIPIINNSNESWLVSATLEGVSFSGPKELRVPRGKQRDYPIRFGPTWILTEKASLTLYNNETGERRIYALFGEAEEPLSEDVIVIECRARERCSEVLLVPDINGVDTLYHVETNIPFTSGEPTLLVRRGGTGRYTLAFHPTMGGTYNGTVVCRAPNGRYVWYAVTVHVSPPEKEGTVEIATDARTPVAADVTIQNPTDKAITFTVRRYGGGLYGENTMLVEAGAPAVYSLLFVPSHLGTFEGRIAFCNEEVGEFWYELRLIVELAAPEEIAFESEIGVSEVVQVRIPNNTSMERSLYVSNTNSRNFSTAPSILTIPPQSELTVDIVYTPTTVTTTQEALIRLHHPDLGEWRYACRGVGILPSPADPMDCVCEVGGKTPVTLRLTNPFDAPMPLDVALEKAAVAPAEGGTNHSSTSSMSVGECAFALLPAPRHPIAPGAEFLVSLTFAPTAAGTHGAVVTVRGLEGVAWEFLLRGLAEWRARDAPRRLRCAARRRLDETLLLAAPGLRREDGRRAEVLLELPPQQPHAAAVRAALQCRLLPPSASETDVVAVAVRFSPLRPFVASADLVLRGKGGAVWRFPLLAEATRAEVDDTIHVTATLRAVAAVRFNMYNVFPHSAAFSAYFTAESSKDLSVAPTRGVLRPCASGGRAALAAVGTPLQVQFAPSARVPQVEGTLIVDTEDMQWSFRVIGKLKGRGTEGK